MALSRTDDLVERKAVPAELQEQWEKDRLKKAKKKSERELARLEAAFDPLVTKKGRKKYKKAMAAAARLDSPIKIPHQILDMDSVEQQIRLFLTDKDGKSMPLPACDKSTRKKIHNLAALFGLDSKSNTGALGRYTTLFKTTRSGKNIDERKVARMMKGFKYRASYDVSDDDWDYRGKGKGKDKGKGKGKLKLKKVKDQSGHPRTKEGDVVGHVRACASIGFDSSHEYSLSPGSSEDRRDERWVHDAGVDGVVRWCDHWDVWRLGCSNHGSHQEDQTWARCWRKREPLITGYSLCSLCVLRNVDDRDCLRTSLWRRHMDR
jgi:hypothetical protein